jgi:predicted RNA-binding Zn-ribbon protein involved in translation (DUF1610 family)
MRRTMLSKLAGMRTRFCLIYVVTERMPSTPSTAYSQSESSPAGQPGDVTDQESACARQTGRPPANRGQCTALLSIRRPAERDAAGTDLPAALPGTVPYKQQSVCVPRHAPVHPARTICSFALPNCAIIWRASPTIPAASRVPSKPCALPWDSLSMAGMPVSCIILTIHTIQLMSVTSYLFHFSHSRPDWVLVLDDTDNRFPPPCQTSLQFHAAQSTFACFR